MHFLLTRPEEDSQKLAQILRALDQQVSCAPVLEINYFDQPEINLSRFQAVLFTSANGVRALIRNSQQRDITCYAVGQATAAEATAAGFQTVITAGGDVQKLAELVRQTRRPNASHLLHVSGTDTVGNLSAQLEKDGFQVTRKRLYRAEKAAALSAKTRNVIKAGDISHMPFFSPRTAKTFVDLARAAHIETYLSSITALCLSSATADVIRSLVWRNVLTAAQPDQTRLFKLADLTLEENRQ